MALAYTSPAHAYTEPRTYFESPDRGGGGGRWFTGSPAEGYGCSVCHSGRAPEELRVEGLPLDGYEPGEIYEVRLSWPKFAARAREIRETRAEPASAGLVAEFVAQTGQAAGTLTVAAAEDARNAELCVLPEGVQAAQLYGMRPGAAVTEEGIHCEANGLGRRCIAAMLACGSEEMRLQWTAPAEPQGAIWFAAGFVATEHKSGDAERDGVTEILRVMRPASASGNHEETLRAGCSVLRGSGRQDGHARGWLAGAFLASIALRLRKRRVRGRV